MEKKEMNAAEINSAIKVLDYMRKRLKRCLKEGSHVRVKANVVNTGIIENPGYFPEPEGWKQYIDLGGRFIAVEIEFPNRRI